MGVLAWCRHLWRDFICSDHIIRQCGPSLAFNTPHDGIKITLAHFAAGKIYLPAGTLSCIGTHFELAYQVEKKSGIQLPDRVPIIRPSNGVYPKCRFKPQSELGFWVPQP